MLRNARGESIGYADMEDMADWFIRHMTMDQRVKLMAERPLLYFRYFPEVAPATISSRVFDAITAEDHK